jgi:acetate kinase
VTGNPDVLVVNVGSSSVKLRLLDSADTLLASRDVESFDDDVLQAALGDFSGVKLVGHRIVHGGSRFRTATIIDDDVRSALMELIALAPLHQSAALAALDTARAVLPAAVHVGCFDTAFHATMPAVATTYALPAGWRDDHGVRRYGFHGLSHAYAARRAAQLLGRKLCELRMVTCHLGAGASLCAVRGGESIETTMGFTPLEGLVMATRSGTIDPGLLLWLIRYRGLSPEAVEEALEHRSGIFGLTGTADMRVVLARAGGGDAEAELAVDVYDHRLRLAIAAMAASLRGLDAIVFTGGIGEHSPEVRRRAAAGLGFLGVDVDDVSNGNVASDRDAEISTAEAAVRTVVVRAREDIQMAAEIRALH